MHGNSIYPPYYGGMPNFSRGLTGISLGMPRGSYLFQKLGQDFANIHISRRYLCIKNGIFAFCAKKKECIYIIMNI